MNVIEHDGNTYPFFQAEGNAAQFAMPFAKKMCRGKGVDIGAGRIEWAFPGATIVDPEVTGLSAYDFASTNLDYIFSSHCLEHLNDWVGTLDFWGEKLNKGGVMFLYLPHYSQTYWRPWNHRNSTNQSPHVNILTPEYLNDYFVAREYSQVWTTGPDLNNAFYAVGVK